MAAANPFKKIAAASSSANLPRIIEEGDDTATQIDMITYLNTLIDRINTLEARIAVLEG